jgi:hypothetical protein
MRATWISAPFTMNSCAANLNAKAHEAQAGDAVKAIKERIADAQKQRESSHD